MSREALNAVGLARRQQVLPVDAGVARHQAGGGAELEGLEAVPALIVGPRRQVLVVLPQEIEGHDGEPAGAPREHAAGQPVEVVAAPLNDGVETPALYGTGRRRGCDGDELMRHRGERRPLDNDDLAEGLPRCCSSSGKG